MFVNIFRNSLQAINQNGEIKITTESKDELLIQISDSGTGIAPEYIGKIFDPFFTTKEQGAGSGLGLSISYNTIKEHSGRIEFESVLSAGTTAKIHLPIKEF